MVFKKSKKVEEQEFDGEVAEDLNSGVGGEEEGATPKKAEQKERYLVVQALPTQKVRQTTDEETGIITNFVTVEEALSDIMNSGL